MGWLAPFLVYDLRKKNLIMNKEIGRKYGHLTVVEDTGRRYHGSIIFKCVCDCGNFKDVSSNKLHSGHVISCGCVNHRIRDLTGRRFGRLTVVSFKGRLNHKTLWNCLCDCGNACVASTASLTTGSTTSCGCRNKENQAGIDSLRTGFVDGTSVTAIDGRRKTNRNNTSGHNGVSYDASRKKWVAQLTFQRKNHLIGRFKYKREAITARKEAEGIYYGKYRKKEVK
jgi:hypothetical protein